MTQKEHDDLKRLGLRLRGVASTCIDLKFNGELFNQKLDSVLAAMMLGELPVPATKEEFSLLMKSVLPGCITSVS